MNFADNKDSSTIKKRFIAHRRAKDGADHCLWDHLNMVSALTGQFSSEIGLQAHGNLIGLLHDLGKASSEFATYIMSATGHLKPGDDGYVNPEETKGKIDHSTAGAQIVYRFLNSKDPKSILASQILSIPIASHHSGLIDCITPDGSDNYTRRMNKNQNATHCSEALDNLDQEIKNILDDIIKNHKMIDSLFDKIISTKESHDSDDIVLFKAGLLLRFLLSCLIDADRIDTADFEFPYNSVIRNHGKYTPWDVLIDRFNEYLCSFKADKPIDALRKEISEQCRIFSEQPKGIYQLTVPTGGGKTLSSLRFALLHAAKHNMKRIIYVIPYTSIIDQNADVVRNIFKGLQKEDDTPEEIVLEHHSNLTPEEENLHQRILSENWDAPIIFTTMVHFLEALFEASTGSVRRMHNLTNSVLIFDEIQTLPIRCVHMFNIALRFLVKGCGSTAILCTATQPLLDKVDPKEMSLKISENQKIISNTEKLFKELKRVEVYDLCKTSGWTSSEISEFAQKELNDSKSILIIVNTKKQALELYQRIKELNFVKVFHLSTNMCPVHRMDVLNSIKNDYLPYKKPVICVTTQLIEAGVDIDFECVIRYLAGLDSIAQAAGRCNRNGEMKRPGKVFILNLRDEDLKRLIDIRIGKEITERILSEYKDDPSQFDNDRIGLKAMNRFYHYYFHKRKEEMCYRTSRDSEVGRDDDLFTLLSSNTLSVKRYQEINGSSPKIILRQSFMTAANVFKAIDSPCRGVVVPYLTEGRRIISELCSAIDLEKQYKLLKEAQRYSINLFPNLINKLTKKQIIHEAQESSGILYLDEQFYSDEFGLSETALDEMELLNY